MYYKEINVTEETIGQLIKRLREETGLSQRKLADLSGIDRAYISQLEGGRTSSISLRTARALAKGLGRSPEIFLKPNSAALARETPEDILERLRLAQPVSIPVYSEFPVHAGDLMEPVEYIYRARARAARKSVEGYLIHGKCLEPVIRDMDIIVVDRDAEINSGDVVAALVGDSMTLGRLRRIDDELWLENNEGRIKFEDCQVVAVVIEVIRRLK